MEMDDKPIYATLEAMIPTKEDDHGTVLVRRFPSEVMKGTAYDLVQRMLDPEGDALNEPYNAVERDIANTVTNWFKEAEKDPEYGVSVIALDNNGIEVPMDDKTPLENDKYASVIKVKEETDQQTNAQERYKLIDLFAKRRVPSGYSDLGEMVFDVSFKYLR